MGILLNLLACLGLAAVCSAAGADARPRLFIYTEISAPSVVMHQGQVAGFTTEKLVLALQRAGIGHELAVLPFKRAYVQVQQRQQSCLYSVTRNPEREHLFKWVGPTHESDWTLFGRAGRDYAITTIEDARKYRIGALFGDIRSETLQAEGYRVDTVNERLANPRKLLVDRIDLWASSMWHGTNIVQANGWSGRIVPVLTFRRTELYLACHRSVPDLLVARLNSALRALETEGISAAIERKYGYVRNAARP